MVKVIDTMITIIKISSIETVSSNNNILTIPSVSIRINISTKITGRRSKKTVNHSKDLKIR
jgi:hypothetical protein